MKTFLRVSLFLCFVESFSYKAQVPDTLAYAKQFEANKANYIGQPFSKLLNDKTQLQPKSIWSDINRINTYNSMFKFNDMEDSFDVVTVNMIIFWHTAIPVSETEYYEKKMIFILPLTKEVFMAIK